jgi:polysaccharide chain length determinant protein (PEP-CTERM system associated)
VIPGKQYKPADLLSIARRRWWLVLLPFLLLGAGTAITTRFIPNRFRSETLILVVPQRVPESYVKSTVTTRIEDRLQSIQQQILSRTRLERIIVDLNLYQKERRTGIMEDIVVQMRQDINVEVVKGDAFRIAFTGDDPRSVMQATERLASLFIEENLRDRSTLAENSYEFLDSQLDSARSRLIDYEKKLEEYRRKHAGELPTQLQANLQVIQNTQMQVQALDESMARDRDRRLLAERTVADLTTPEPVAAATGAAPTGDGLAGADATATQQLEAAQQALRQMQLRLTAEHPDIIRMKRVIANLTEKVNAASVDPQPAAPAAAPGEGARQNRVKELRAEIENIDRQLARKEAEQKQLRGVIKDYQTRAEASPTRESELIELTRDYGTLQASYTTLLAKKEDSKIAANLEQRQIGEQFKVLDQARLPEKPYSPDRVKLNALGAAVGLLLGLAIVGLLEFADSTLKTDDDIMSTLSLPVIAMVPMMLTPFDKRRTRIRAMATAAASVAALLIVSIVAWRLSR